MILLLNGSLKGAKGNSRYFLDHLSACYHGDCRHLEITAVLRDMDGFIESLRTADALVLGVPLYVDGLPAQVLRLMELLYDRCRSEFPALPVYVVSNLGFFESTQIRILLDMIRNWCVRMQMPYGGGLAIGAGGMMTAFRSIPIDKGPNRDLGRGIRLLADSIAQKSPIENRFIQPVGVPRFAYILAAHRLFRSTGRKNGIAVR